MLSIATLYRLTPTDIRRRAITQVRVQFVRAIADSDSMGIHKLVYINSTATTIRRISVLKIYGKDESEWNFRSKLWCSCSCEHYKYTLEVANAMKGSSMVIFSNGALPRSRNPGYRPYLCKHLVAALLPSINAPLTQPAPTMTTGNLASGFRYSNLAPVTTQIVTRR